MMCPPRNPHSLSRDDYGGAGKRLFIGLMTGSCVLLCLGIVLLWLVPFLGLHAIHASLPWLLGVLSACLVFFVAWMCLALIWHVYSGRSFWGIHRIRALTIRLMFPLMELLGRALGFERARIRSSFIKVNNEMVLASGVRVYPEQVLLLLPHCVQRSSCVHRLSVDVGHCARCGLCAVGSLLALRDTLGFSLAIASGGTVARRIVVQTRPSLIIAIACERDLSAGILDTYPLPVYGVLNSRPNGPCVDTQVSVSAVAAVLGILTSNSTTAP